MQKEKGMQSLLEEQMQSMREPVRGGRGLSGGALL